MHRSRRNQVATPIKNMATTAGESSRFPKTSMGWSFPDCCFPLLGRLLLLLFRLGSLGGRLSIIVSENCEFWLQNRRRYKWEQETGGMDIKTCRKNHCPMHPLCWQALTKRWNGIKRISRMNVALCWVKQQQAPLGKLDPRGQRCVNPRRCAKRMRFNCYDEMVRIG